MSVQPATPAPPATLAYVVAPAYNEIELVLMAFPTTEQAVQHLTNLGLVAKADNPLAFTKATVGGETLPLEDALEGDGEDVTALRDGLFARGDYYGGCGECRALYVVEMPLGEPVVAFNLD